MSVLIKDFEMPKNCAECKFSDVFTYPPDYDDEWICGLTYIGMDYGDAQMRHSNCPLIEVPPHGRLIDKDAIPWEHATNSTYQDWAYRRKIDAMPTIIEAEDT